MSLVLFLLMIRLPPTSTLFPYTTLFRSSVDRLVAIDVGACEATGSGAFTQVGRVGTASSCCPPEGGSGGRPASAEDRKSTRLNSSHANISYAVFCLKKKKNTITLR